MNEISATIERVKSVNANITACARIRATLEKPREIGVFPKYYGLITWNGSVITVS